jgi:predicted DNA binding CopG/RHH family protein
LHPDGRKRIAADMESEERHTKRKGGRPKKAVKKDAVTAVRFTKIEYAVVKQKASKAGLCISVYIRQMAVNGKVTPRINEEQSHFVRQLAGMANNLNQLAKKAHQEGLLKAMLYFEGYRNQLDELINRLTNDQ